MTNGGLNYVMSDVTKGYVDKVPLHKAIRIIPGAENKIKEAKEVQKNFRNPEHAIPLYTKQPRARPPPIRKTVIRNNAAATRP